ncbi:hypothetical protein DIURU_005051 [Diutina rugosa]|uniref:Translation initiation factor eIF2B subunit gamma n=1 Tax=Diutina rugosa TaxID=5481 RepID=A0A642UK49_DIURU|nr:uncharacterized protein DIURU_005051 [Diutina rugosa]KAA8898196.1 hypothetical protein DIURU_005051 [Diutina rugosa]
MEFHAIIVCGPGKQLAPFSQERSAGFPKPLLPVANKPMIHYALDFCTKAFFANITVVCPEEAMTLVQESIDNYRKSVERLEIDVQAYDCPESGSVIHQLAPHIKSPHFVVLPCDFITDLPPQVLIEQYRNRGDSDFGLAVFHKQTLEVEDKKHKQAKLYTMYSDDGHLLDVQTTKDIEFHKSLPVRSQMTWRHPQTTISTTLLNSSIFFGSAAVFKALEEPKFDDVYLQTHSLLKIVRDLARRSWKHSQPKDTVGIFVIPHQATFIRCNTLPMWTEANRYFMKLKAAEVGKSGSVQPKDKSAANIGIDSFVGEETHIGSRSAVKRSAIGSGCNIGERVKLTGCLILDNVTIENDVQLENCIIGAHCLIKSKSKLTSCNVESTHEVSQGTVAKNENLKLLSLEGIVNDDKDDSDDSVTDSEDESGSDWSEGEDEWANNDDGLFDY